MCHISKNGHKLLLHSMAGTAPEQHEGEESDGGDVFEVIKFGM